MDKRGRKNSVSYSGVFHFLLALAEIEMWDLYSNGSCTLLFCPVFECCFRSLTQDDPLSLWLTYWNMWDLLEAVSLLWWPVSKIPGVEQANTFSFRWEFSLLWRQEQRFVLLAVPKCLTDLLFHQVLPFLQNCGNAFQYDCVLWHGTPCCRNHSPERQ